VSFLKKDTSLIAIYLHGKTEKEVQEMRAAETLYEFPEKYLATSFPEKFNFLKWEFRKKSLFDCHVSSQQN
jgi:hypothetical protein